MAGLGHSLLAEIRSVVYRRSLPLATGNLPIVLSELGGEAGVVGAARADQRPGLRSLIGTSSSDRKKLWRTEPKFLCGPSQVL